jgi:hypothetical protein
MSSVETPSFHIIDVGWDNSGIENSLVDTVTSCNCQNLALNIDDSGNFAMYEISGSSFIRGQILETAVMIKCIACFLVLQIDFDTSVHATQLIVWRFAHHPSTSVGPRYLIGFLFNGNRSRRQIIFEVLSFIDIWSISYSFLLVFREFSED